MICMAGDPGGSPAFFRTVCCLFVYALMAVKAGSAIFWPVLNW